MRVLAIETSAEACSIALFEGEAKAGTLIAHDHRIIGRGHAEMLVPMIAALPDKGRADRLAVSLGPGSFTGVRIGIATARALGVAWNAPVLGYSSLSLIAAMALAKHEDAQTGGVTVCINGGHGEFFIQNFTNQAVAQDLVSSLSPAEAAKGARNTLIAGNTAEAMATLIDNDDLIIDPSMGDAGYFYLLKPEAITHDLKPIYGRAPDAKPQKASAT